MIKNDEKFFDRTDEDNFIENCGLENNTQYQQAISLIDTIFSEIVENNSFSPDRICAIIENYITQNKFKRVLYSLIDKKFEQYYNTDKMLKINDSLELLFAYSLNNNDINDKVFNIISKIYDRYRIIQDRLTREEEIKKQIEDAIIKNIKNNELQKTVSQVSEEVSNEFKNKTQEISNKVSKKVTSDLRNTTQKVVNDLSDTTQKNI